jgi:sulfate permease, SulP family
VAAPLAGYIPLAALAGLLAVVAWNMAERHAFARLIRASRGDALVLLATFLLTIFRDLATGIVVGFALAALLFLHRMAQAVEIETVSPLLEEDESDRVSGDAQTPYDASVATDPDVIVYRISGAFFFAAAATVTEVLDSIAEHPKAYVIDFAGVAMLDSTAAAAIEGFVRKARRHGVAIYVTGAHGHVRRILRTHGVRRPDVAFYANVNEAVAAAHAALLPPFEAAQIALLIDR